MIYQSIIHLLLPFSSFACLAMKAVSASNAISARSVWEEMDRKEELPRKARIPNKEDYPLYEDLFPPSTIKPLKIEEAIEEIYPGVFPLAVQLPDEVSVTTPSNIDEIYRLGIEGMKKEETIPSTLPPLKPDEFIIGESGVPLTRLHNNTQCKCSTSVYNQQWCPYGISREECDRDYLTLPNDSDSVFILSTDNCSLHFECSSDYSLYANVFLPLGVFPEPSNIEKELKTAQRNGFATAFECSQEGNFELVFVSSKRRVVFVIHDLACVRRFQTHKVSKKTKKRMNSPSSSASHSKMKFENVVKFRG